MGGCSNSATPAGRRQLLAVALLALAVPIAGCGSEESDSEPRPPAPIEVTARVGEKAVTVAPNEFGAGLVNFTISNQSDDVVELTVEGNQLEASADLIQPNAVGNFKLGLAEGSYEVTPGPDSDARPDTLEVGPPRASSQNQLLLP